jgi:serine/threonine protein kinase
MHAQAGIAYDSKMADVWAAGVLLHYMLTGRLPNLDAGYVPPRHLSEGCRRLLRRMLRTSPAERASIPEIMQNPWFLQDCPEVSTSFVRLHTCPTPGQLDHF